MRTQYVLLACAALLLPGCAALIAKLTPDWPTQPTGNMVGKTYAQLVAEKRADQQIVYEERDIPYYCYSCDGQPTRTYVNAAGNTVAAYFYNRNINYTGEDPRSVCDSVEERYELREGVVVDQWYFLGAESEKFPLYTKNVCGIVGWNQIDVADPPAKPHKPGGLR